MQDDQTLQILGSLYTEQWYLKQENDRLRAMAAKQRSLTKFDVENAYEDFTIANKGIWTTDKIINFIMELINR